MPSEQTSENAAKFRKLSEIARLIHESIDLDDALQRLASGVCMHSNWTTSSILALDLERQATTPIVRYDPYRPATDTEIEEWDAGTSPLARVIETRQPLVLKDAAKQAKYLGYRDDARRRGYHTVVIIPLRFPDSRGRSIVFSVKSSEVVQVDAAEMGFLQCLADLADIAVRRMQILHRESEEALSLRDIVNNLTAALATSLDPDRATGLFSVLSRLFTTGWFAIDLTSGRTLFDASARSPMPEGFEFRAPDSLVRQALHAGHTTQGQNIRISLDGISHQNAHMSSLVIDGTIVGALFLLNTAALSTQQEVLVQTGRFALSTLILRGYLGFKSRAQLAQRLMKRLFTGDLTHLDELTEDAKFLDFDLNDTSRLLAISGGGREAPSETAHVFISLKARSYFGRSISCMEDGKFFVLVRDTAQIDDPTQRDGFLRAIQPVLPRNPTIVRSDPVNGVSPVPRIYQLCLRNLGMARSMGIDGWVAGAMLGRFPSLISTVSDTTALEFLAKTIIPIADGGSAKGALAIETLTAYLKSGRRLQETADALVIHVSTLRYRLERLSLRHKLDLEDPETCFELDLALRLHLLRSSYQT